MSDWLIPLTVLGPSTMSNIALYSEWYGPVLGPSTVSARLVPLTVQGHLTVLGPSTVSGTSLPLTVLGPSAGPYHSLYRATLLTVLGASTVSGLSLALTVLGPSAGPCHSLHRAIKLTVIPRRAPGVTRARGIRAQGGASWSTRPKERMW